MQSAQGANMHMKRPAAQLVQQQCTAEQMARIIPWGGPSLLSMVLTNAGERRPGYEAQWPEYGSLLYRVTRPVGNIVCLATNKFPHFRSSGDKFVHDHLLMKFQRLLHWLHCHLPLPPGHLPHPHSTAHFETTSKAQGGASIVCCSSDREWYGRSSSKLAKLSSQSRGQAGFELFRLFIRRSCEP